MSRPLWLRSLRSRPLTNLLLFTLAAVAVMTAVLGPLLVRAIQQSTMTETVAAAGAANTSVTLSTNGAQGEDLARLEGVIAGVLAPVESGPSAGLWTPSLTWTESIDNLAWATRSQQGKGETISRVVVADEGCAGLPVTSGRCPQATGEVAISGADAKANRAKVGDQIIYRLPGVLSAQFTVVGLYDPDRATTPITRPDSERGLTAAVTGEPLVTTAAQLTALPVGTTVSSRLSLRRPVTLADAPLLRQAVDQVNAAMFKVSVSLVLDTRLPDVLDRVDTQGRAAQVLVGVTQVQALGLALFSLAAVLQRVGQARRAEWGIGRLLGVSRRRWFTSVFAEPVLVLLAGLPVGYAAGVGVAYVARAVQLPAGTPLEMFRWPVLAAAVAATLAGLLALVAVSAPSVRSPLAELIQQRSEARGTTVLGGVVQTTVVLLAAATLYTLLAGGVLSSRGSQLGLLAPGLFALALAVLAVRAAVLVVRRVTRRPSRRLAAIVVGRQAARTPSALNPAIVIAVGLAVAVFATQVYALSVRNQELRASAIAGANTVLRVSTPAGTDLIDTVRSADPSGRYAMAVQERVGETVAGSGRVVAVDSTRLAAVAAWSPAWAEVADVATALRPATWAPITLTGTTVTVRVSSVDLKADAPLTATKPPADPELLLRVDTGRAWRTVRLGAVAASNTTHTADLPCSGGCRIVGIGIESGALQPYVASFTVTSVSTDRDPAADSKAWLNEPGRWHTRVSEFYDPDPDAQAVPSDSAAGLKVAAYDQQGGTEAYVSPSDVDDPLPAIIGPNTTVQAFGGIPQAAFGIGLDGNSQLIRVVARASALPRAVGDGVLVDLRNATGLIDPQSDRAQDEVWLAAGAPPQIEQALVAAGLRVVVREQLADARATHLAEPTTRAAAVSVTLATAALLLTLLTLVGSRVADARRRRADWRSLRDAGLSRATLRRLVAVEIAVPALLGVLIGVGGGIGALVLAAPRLPLVDLSVAGPPLELGLSWPPVLVLSLGAAAVVVLVAVVGAVLEVGAGERR